MAWAQKANIKGPKGDPGDPGDAGTLITNVEVNGSGELVITLDPGGAQNLGNVVGPKGEDGTSVEISGSVATADDLAALATSLGLGAEDAGRGWIAQDTGNLHVWDGDSWDDVGTIRGPDGREIQLQNNGTVIRWRYVEEGQGAEDDWTTLAELSALTGDQGPRGATWFDGEGAPEDLPGEQVGDYYLDTETGVVYKLEA